jgi:O-antigen ligase
VIPGINPLVLWAFLVVAFSMPIEYPTPLPTQIHTVAACVFLLTALLQPSLCFRRPPAAVWWVSAYLWIYFVVTLFSAHPTGSSKPFLHFLVGGLLLWTSSNLLRDPRIGRAALASFVLGSATLAGFELAGIGLSTFDPDDRARHTVFGQDPNFVGGHMALALVALLGFVAASRRAWPIPFAVGVGALLAHSLLTAASRGAFAGTVAGLLGFAAAGPTPRSVLRHLSVAVLVASGLVWAGSGFESARRRVETAVVTGQMSGRERIYHEAWQMIVERPVLGWGPMDARYELRLRTASREIEQVRKSPLERDAHNLVLEALMTAGLVGTIPFLTAIGLCVLAAWRGRAGPYGATPFALIAAIVVLGMSSTWSMSKEAWLFFGYGLAATGEATR